MIGVFNTITINGTEVYRPNEFTLQRENVYAAEIETCIGKRIADLVGWRYADMTLSFDTLPQAMLDDILAISGEVTMEFANESNESVTEQVIVRASTAQVTRFTNYEGDVLWKDFEIEISFINAHPNKEN